MGKSLLSLNGSQIEILVQIYNEIKKNNEKIMQNLVNRFTNRFPNIKVSYWQLKNVIDKQVSFNSLYFYKLSDPIYY